MLRRLLQLHSRVGRPGTRLTVGDSDGRRLYLSASAHPVEISVPLERDQVRQLVAVCSAWLDERDAGPRISPTAAAHRSRSTVQA